MNEHQETDPSLENALTVIEKGDLPTIKPEITPEQARVNSVAETMSVAMSKASTLVLTAEEIEILQKDFPDEAFQPGASGKANLIYIEHAFLRDRFTEAVGMGQWAILRTRPHWAEEFTTSGGKPATRIYADCILMIRGCMVAEGIGNMTYYPNNPSQDYGDAAEGAISFAFRRCAKNFGVGLQAWKKGFCAEWLDRKSKFRRQSQPPPRDYVKEFTEKFSNAQTLKDLAKIGSDLAAFTLCKPDHDDLSSKYSARKAVLTHVEEPEPEITDAMKATADGYIKALGRADSIKATEAIMRDFGKDEDTLGKVLVKTVNSAAINARSALDQLKLS